MTRVVHTHPLTAAAFAPFGDVLDATGAPDKLINQGLCERFDDRARLDFGADGRAGISIFNARPRALPYASTWSSVTPTALRHSSPCTSTRFW